MNRKHAFWNRLVCAGVFGLTLTGLVLTASALPQPNAPANDNCAGAIVISASGPFPHLTAVVPDITGATTGSEPAPSCSSEVSRSIWYRFTPGQSGPYSFSVCDDTATTVSDTVMALFSATGNCTGLSEVSCSDDACGLFGLRSAMTESLTAGTTYYLVVWAFGAASQPPAPSETAVQVRVTRPIPPSNDLCSGAEIVPAAGPFPWLSAVSPVTLATTIGDPPPPSCQQNVMNSIWYKFTPAKTATYRLSTCSPAATTLPDSVMAIYTSVGNCAGPFTEVACNDDLCDLLSAITTPLTAGTAYYIVVWAFDSGGSTLLDAHVQFHVSRVSPPLAVSGAATTITASAGTLNGTVKPNGLDTVAWFEWGGTGDFGNVTAEQNIGNGTNAVAVSALLEEIAVNTTLYYRLVATNLDGVSVGAEMSFSTTGGAEQRFTLQERLPNGQFRVQFTGTPAQACTVQVSSDLVNWTDAGAGSHLGNGLFEFIDQAAPASGVRFYRVKSP